MKAQIYLSPSDQKSLDSKRSKNWHGISDIIAACTPLIEGGTSPATTIAQQMEIERTKRGISPDDWPETILTQLLEKWFRCHSGLLTRQQWNRVTQQQEAND